MSSNLKDNNKDQNKLSQSQEIEQKMEYKMSPEEMWNSINSSSQHWGIKGYQITKKYYDYRRIKWEKKRKDILDAHKKEWPPLNWPKNKATDKLEPPKKLSFIDEMIAWSNSFTDPKKSEEMKQKLETSRGTYKYPDKKSLPNIRERFLKREKDKQEKFDQLPKVQPWKENAIEEAKRKIEEDKGKIKTQFEKNKEKYTKEKPWWARADRITMTGDAEYIGENIPFYDSSNKEESDDKKGKNLFFPKKNFILRRAPSWIFQGKSPMKLPTENMKTKESLIKEKIDNFKAAKNLSDKDLQIDVIGSAEKIKNRGKSFFQYKKPFDYGSTEQYKTYKQNHPIFFPGPTHYWKDKLKDLDTNTRPKEVVQDAEVNGRPGKIYFMNHKRTDFRQYKPLRRSIF